MTTPKERWHTLMRGRRPGRPLCDFWGTSELIDRLKSDFGCRTEAELWACLDIDKCIFLAPRHPKAIETTWHIPSLFSIWGIETERVPYLDGLGAYEEAVNPPLARVSSPNEIRAYEWPNAGDWDCSHLRCECEEWRDYPIVGASYEPFYLYCRLRGMSLGLSAIPLKSAALA